VKSWISKDNDLLNRDLKKIEIAKNLVTGQQAVEASGSETATEEN